nr:alpha-amylase family glycosyl hydrolase [Paraflavitalea speifideiaquila]
MLAPAWSKKAFYCIYVTFSLLLLQGCPAHAQDPPQYGTPYAGVPDPRDVNMYQVHIRPYSAAGNLAGVTARLDAIRALGTNVIYLMPHYPNGTDSRSSISPYCIKDFKGVGAEYGNLTNLRALVDGAHSRGMAVILDWVANQTSWDHPWITQHPDWYVRDGNGVIQPLNPFPDVAALNFSSSAMRTEMINSMRYWVFAANVDGFRCDYANNAPLDFWTQAINNLRGITTHKLLMFAEGDRLENFNAGFDMNFGDQWYYDAIRQIAGGASVAQIQTTTNTEYTFAGASQQVVRYTANHDTEGDATPFSVFQNHAGVVVNFLVSAYMRGVPFLTSGQEVGHNQTIPWPYTSVKINWSANPTIAADFTTVLNFRTTSTAIRRGAMTNYSNTNVCAFTKISGSEKVVVMANLRNNTQTFVIPAALAGSYVDAYSGASVTLTSSNPITDQFSIPRIDQCQRAHCTRNRCKRIAHQHQHQSSHYYTAYCYRSASQCYQPISQLVIWQYGCCYSKCQRSGNRHCSRYCRDHRHHGRPGQNSHIYHYRHTGKHLHR